MGHIRPVRTEADHEAALARIEELMDARPGTPEGDELDVLATLVDAYEEKRFPIGSPNPVEAILFRMEQAGMTRRDLEPLIGSRAKVSEVLNGRRPLTLPMIRALARIGIPADVLVGGDEEAGDEAAEEEWSRYPVLEIARCGWFGTEVGDPRERAATLMMGLRSQAGGRQAATCGLYRKNDELRGAKADPYALTAWCWRSLALARKERVGAYDPKAITLDFIREVARLSPASDGPSRARRFLAQHGIRLVAVRHLTGTHLDGAALRLVDDMPVVSLTLRHDRLDNFWFCLAHELAHIGRHFGGDTRAFFDDLSSAPRPGEQMSKEELEANEWAGEALIPAEAWRESPVASNPSPTNVLALANDLGIHAAIVAGRVRYERRNYRLLSHFVGTGQVRNQLGFTGC